MGTKNNPGNYDCYQNAEPDEPMFVLLGRDKHAAALVLTWAIMREWDGETPEKVKEAKDCANAMAAWCEAHEKQPASTSNVLVASMVTFVRAIQDLFKKELEVLDALRLAHGRPAASVDDRPMRPDSDEE